MKSLRTIFASLILALGLASMAPAAWAGDPVIDAAIQSGQVGERIDGRLGVVGSADPAVVRKVQEINNKRAAKYAEIAAETGTSVAQVARVTGEKLISDLKPGQYYMDASGSWKQK